MSATLQPTRRDVLRLAALAGAAVVIEATPGGRIRRIFAAEAPPAAGFRGKWVAIAPDGKVTITVARGEMGQGVRTTLATILADEMDCDWKDVAVFTPSPGPDYRQMRTSGSWSVGGGYEPYRRIGATVRDLLVRAAAARWNVPATDCTTEPGFVVHAATKRRLGYGALAGSLAALTPSATPAMKDAARFRLIGKPMKRIDGRAIVTGTAGYGVDVRLPQMQCASVERGPSLGATPARVDDAAARAVPGVERVVTVPSGVAVIARDSWSAQRGREALKVEWTPGPNAAFDSREFLRALHDASAEAGWEARAAGDVEKTLAAAPRKLEAVYEYAFQAHAPLEPMNTTALVGDGRCELWLGTQAANQVQEAVAQRLGIEPGAVTIHSQLMGGGFGRRLGVDMALEAAEVSRAIGGPVQVLWSRSDDLRYGYFQPGSVHRMAGALGANGEVVAWKHTMAGVPHSAFSEPAFGVDLARDLMWGGFDNPYVYPNLRVAHVTRKPPVPTGPWRAVHYPPGVLARECFMDELAAAAGKDPIAFRLAALGTSTEPTAPRLANVLKLAAETSGWGGALPAGRARGVAANVYDGDTVLVQVAEVSVASDRTVKVHRLTCVVDCGTVVNPLGAAGQVESAVVFGLTAALKGEITFANGLAEQSGFFDYPVLAMHETPEIAVHFVPSNGPPLGLGEQCVSPVAAAVNNAVSAAIGRRVRRSPIRAEDLG